MGVEGNLDFKLVSSRAKNTFMMIIKRAIQMIQDKIALIFTIRILIMNNTWYACILMTIASRRSSLMR